MLGKSSLPELLIAEESSSNTPQSRPMVYGGAGSQGLGQLRKIATLKPATAKGLDIASIICFHSR